MSKKPDGGFIPLDTIVMWQKQFEEESPITYEEMCCIIDDSNGEPSCVWDENKQGDCIVSNKGIKKSECEYWINKIRYNEYYDLDVWNWLKGKAI